MRFAALVIALLLAALAAIALPWTQPLMGPWADIAFLVFGCLALLGLHDLFQTRHSLLRNYPLLAHLRFLQEKIRPEIRQYFLESDLDGVPFNRSTRAIVYQRAKGQLDKRPFGTQLDVYGRDYEWLTHSLAPAPTPPFDFRVMVGGPDCARPYSLSLFNISAMSFGSLSANAIRALNKGAAMGGFAHDTGEGGFSAHHRVNGGDIIWEIGSGYFGCRNEDGSFNAERFEATARDPQVKMIEIKLSQGAKPGHGGVLPGAKVTAEIAAARGVPAGVDCVSPARHPAFSTPLGLMQFIARLRKLSGGKPVGFKLCIGHPGEFMALCKAMLESGITPDFIVIDGAEGGTGAAPLEFTDHVGTPLREGLVFAHNALVGTGLRDKIRLGAGGRIVTAFDMVRILALGADWCNSARGFMFALGCVQSLSCHTDRCPTGVATQNPSRQRALVVEDKATRVRMFHDSTLKALAELVAAAGVSHPGDVKSSQIMRRLTRGNVDSLAEVYPSLAPGDILSGKAPPRYLDAWQLAQADSFAPRVRGAAGAAG